MRIVLGLLIVIAGTLMTIKNDKVYAFTGPNRWAEEHLGTEGGTRLLIKLLGMLAVVIGLATMTGLIGGFIATIVRFVFPGLR